MEVVTQPSGLGKGVPVRGGLGTFDLCIFLGL